MQIQFHPAMIKHKAKCEYEYGEVWKYDEQIVGCPSAQNRETKTISLRTGNWSEVTFGAKKLTCRMLAHTDTDIIEDELSNRRERMRRHATSRTMRRRRGSVGRRSSRRSSMCSCASGWGVETHMPSATAPNGPPAHEATLVK